MKSILLVMLMALLSCSLIAQDLSTSSRWQVLKFGVSMGIEEDRIKGLDYHYMLQSSRLGNIDEFNNVDFAESDYYAGVCENPQLRIGLTLEVPGVKNTELNLSLNTIFNRYDGVYYKNYNANPDTENYEYISITSMTSELGLESSLVKRLPLGRFFNLYGGAGTNIGYSFDGNIDISGYRNVKDVDQNLNRSLADVASGTTYSDETYGDEFSRNASTKNVFHQRVFAQVGIGWVLFERLELGVDYRRGIGYRAMSDAPVKRTDLHSVSASFRWILW